MLIASKAIKINKKGIANRCQVSKILPSRISEALEQISLKVVS